MSCLTIRNCRLADRSDHAAFKVTIHHGRVASIETEPGASAVCDPHAVDAAGRYLIPGLVDVHLQGAGGCNFFTTKERDIRTICTTAARFGVTAVLATTEYKPGRPNEHLQAVAQAVGADTGGAKIVGIHIEGPFISPHKRGMIVEDSIGDTDQRTLDHILKICDGKLKMMTVAPELPNAQHLIKRMTDAGVIASFGHSDADYEQTLRGIEWGITHATHLFNAMRGMHHRDAGPIPALPTAWTPWASRKAGTSTETALTTCEAARPGMKTAR